MIEIEGVSKRYGRVLAVADLTVTVPAGVVTGFLGPNGAGKSTTMRMDVEATLRDLFATVLAGLLVRP